MQDAARAEGAAAERALGALASVSTSFMFAALRVLHVDISHAQTVTGQHRGEGPAHGLSAVTNLMAEYKGLDPGT